MEFRVLGPVEVWSAGQRIDAGHVKQRSVLAVLLLDLGRVVPIDVLIDRVWGDRPPSSVRNNLYAYVARLRNAIASGDDKDAVLLVRRPGGYLLEADAERIDLYRFRRLAAQALASAPSDDRRAAELLSDALDLWRGPALAGLTSPWLSAMGDAIEQQRIGTVLDLGDIALRQGEHAALAGTLAKEAIAHPGNERLASLLMTALYRSGRQADALRWFEQIRRHLADELGADPGSELAALHQQILRNDLVAGGVAGGPAAGGSAAVGNGTVGGAAARGGSAGGGMPVPRELPADTTAFVGRSAELAELHRLLAGSGAAAGGGSGAGAGPSTVAILAVSGTAGVGKTALAVHWAHQIASRFPDGQLYVNLRGYDPGQPITAAEALAGFLRALGVPGQDIPADPAERAARYRSLVAGRRILMLLDNASEVEQVRLLLPGTSTCAVLVTSRDSLAGLVARDGARRSDLDMLSQVEAVALLRALIGVRVDAEPAAAAELAARCARLPLALRIAAELAVARASASLGELASELADGRRLDVLGVGGDERTEVRAVFSWSYHNLGAPAARAFRLLGLHPGLDIDARAVAALIGATAEQAAGLLDVLARAHLIQPAEPGRYGLHDLLREYAGELAGGTDTAAERREALSGLFGYYLENAAAAADVLYPGRRRWRRWRFGAGRAAPAGRLAFTSATARAWLDTELTNLIAAVAHAAAHGWPGHAIDLGATLSRARVGPDVGRPARHRVTRRPAVAIASVAVVGAALATAGVVWSSMAAVGPGAPAAGAGAGAAAVRGRTTPQRVIAPLYAVPTSPFWSSFASAAPTARAVIVDICAPDGSGSGCNGKPADAPSPGWLAIVKALRRAGVVPLYYISTNYAATAIATVKAEVRHAIAWYQTRSIFFDQVPTSCSNVPHYLSLYRFVHQLGGLVMIDPGTVTDESSCYMPAADVMQVFIGPQDHFQSETFPSWLARYPSSRFAAVISAGTRSGVSTDISDAARDRIGNVYVNDQMGTPDFSTLPAFWPAEVADVKAAGRRRG